MTAVSDIVAWPDTANSTRPTAASPTVRATIATVRGAGAVSAPPSVIGPTASPAASSSVRPETAMASPAAPPVTVKAAVRAANAEPSLS